MFIRIVIVCFVLLSACLSPLNCVAKGLDVAPVEDNLSLNSYVLELNEETFDGALQKEGNLLVKFYAPWCGHCQAFKAKYERYARLASLDDDVPKNFIVAKVNAIENENLKDRFGITAYPALRLFVTDDIEVTSRDDDVVITYTGDRRIQDLDQFVKIYTSLTPVLEKSEEVVKQFIESSKRDNHHAVIGYFDSSENPAAIAFQSVAKEMKREVQVESALIYNENISDSDIGLRLYPRFSYSGNLPWFACNASKDPKPESWDDEEDGLWRGAGWNQERIETMKRFMSTRTIPPLSFYGKEGQIRKNFDRGIPSMILIFDDMSAVSSYESDLRAAAQTYPGEISFLFVPMHEAKVLKAFGVENREDGKPVIKLLDARISIARMKRYIYDGDTIDASKLVEFQHRFFRGELESAGLRDFKSKQPVKHERLERVQEVVGSTFVSTVLANQTADIVVMYYAPYCKYCAKFINDYRLMAKNFHTIRSLKFLKMDDTQNEVDFQYYTAIPEVSGYPTFYMFAGTERKPIKYTGKLKYDDLDSWLQESVATPFKLDGRSYGAAPSCLSGDH